MQLIDLYPNRIPAWFNLELYDVAKNLTNSEWRGNLGFRRHCEGHISFAEESANSIFKALVNESSTDEDRRALMPLVWVQDDLEKIQQCPVLLHQVGYKPSYYRSVRRVNLHDIAEMYSFLSESINGVESDLLSHDQKEAFSDVYKNTQDDNYSGKQIPIEGRLDAYYEDVLGAEDSSVLLQVDLWSDQEEDEILEEFREILRGFRGKPRKKRWGKHDTARLYQNMILPILDLYLTERHANMVTANKALLISSISHVIDVGGDIQHIQKVIDSFEPSKYTATDYKNALGLDNLDDNTMLKRIKAAKQWMADYGKMPNIHDSNSQGN